MPTKRCTTPNKESFQVSGEKLVEKVKEVVKAGNARRIILKDDEGKVLMEIPLTFAAIGVLAAPVVAAVGALAAFLTKCTIEVEKKE